MSLNKIKTIKLKISTNQKGDILKYLTRKNKHLKKFGEIYFTEIKKNKIKGWNLHKKCWCLLAVPYGKVKFTFAENIHSKKKTIVIGKKNYSIIVVPPRIWFSFISLAKFSLVVNTLNEIHKKNESLKIPIN
jgi:dTDP-4-dehydrorhamnose 3,5-epimerase-like enzyme|tara:strand:- start:327 stop:722 length:396 start_codon:yes stop_codon:yes gene_type:complete